MRRCIWLLALTGSAGLGLATANATSLVPVASWTFNDSSGPPFLDSVGGLPATASTAVPTTAGVSGNALGPTGPAVTATLPANALASSFSIALWMAPATGGNGAIWAIVDPANGTPIIQLSEATDGTLNWVFGSETVSTSAEVLPQQWNHVVVVYNNFGLAANVPDYRRTVEIWINGFLYGLDEYTTPTALNLPANAALALRPDTGGTTWAGSLDNLDIYTGALTRGDIVGLSGPENTLTAGFFARAYNGLNVPTQWPPRMRWADFYGNTQIFRPWYLDAPPPAINIDTGRQLFVDDFLIADTNLTLSYHNATDYPGNPILSPDQPWEMGPVGTQAGNAATPYSDGVWFDPNVGHLRMWYEAGPSRFTALAESEDGIHWDKPSLDIVPGSNILLPVPATPTTWSELAQLPAVVSRDSNTVWINAQATDPTQRYVMIQTVANNTIANVYAPDGQNIYYSSDGEHWNLADTVGPGTLIDDRTTMFYNPFRQEWAFSIRAYHYASTLDTALYRARAFLSKPLGQIAPPYWDELFGTIPNTPLWWYTDGLDKVYPGTTGGQPQLYDLDATPYESVMVGLFTVLRGRNFPANVGRDKLNEVYLGFSRDGYHYYRNPQRDTAFLSISDSSASWKWLNVQSAGAGLVVTRDWLWIYYFGLGYTAGTSTLDVNNLNGSTGLAYLRRDGFASLDADADGGYVETKNIVFSGKYLFVNVAAADGQLQAEVCDPNGNPLAGFTKEECLPITTDNTAALVKWQGGADLSALAGQTVRLRFYLTNGQFYSFWVSPALDGHSNGYLAGGQPGQSSQDMAGLNPSFATFAQWKMWRYSPLDIANDAVSGQNATDAETGRTNFITYLAGQTNHGESLVPLTMGQDANNNWVLTWLRPKGRGDVTWQVQTSADLESWTDCASVLPWQVQSYDDARDLVTTIVPMVPGQTLVFFRLTAE